MREGEEKEEEKREDVIWHYINVTRVDKLNCVGVECERWRNRGKRKKKNVIYIHMRHYTSRRTS